MATRKLVRKARRTAKSNGGRRGSTQVTVVTRISTGFKRGQLRIEVKTLNFDANGALRHVGMGFHSDVDLFQ